MRRNSGCLPAFNMSMNCLLRSCDESLPQRECTLKSPTKSQLYMVTNNQNEQDEEVISQLRKKQKRNMKENTIKRNDLGESQKTFTQDQLDRLHEIDEQQALGRTPLQTKTNCPTLPNPFKPDGRDTIISNCQAASEDQVEPKNAVALRLKEISNGSTTEFRSALTLLEQLQGPDAKELKTYTRKAGHKKIIEFKKSSSTISCYLQKNWDGCLNSTSNSPLPSNSNQNLIPTRNLSSDPEPVKKIEEEPKLSVFDRKVAEALQASQRRIQRLLELPPSELHFMTPQRLEGLRQNEVLKNLRKRLGNKGFKQFDIRYSPSSANCEMKEDDQTENMTQTSFSYSSSSKKTIKNLEGMLFNKQNRLGSLDIEAILQNNYNRIKDERRRVIARLV